MKKLQSSLTNMAVVLTVISVIAGGVLAYINKVTSGPISELKEKTLQDGIKQVVLGTTEGTLDVQSIDTLESGYIVYTIDKGTAVQGGENGFGGKLDVLVGFDAEGNIKGYTILATQETPGLGVKAAEWFQKGNKGDIIGMNPGEKELTVSKDGGNVDAITASTITSRAFLKTVNNAYQAFKSGSVEATTGASKQAHHGEEAPSEEVENSTSNN
jgi:electron transport complex protein RnfG